MALLSPSLAAPTDPAVWARELLQARLMGRLFAQRVHDLALKGGLALRAAYGSYRATKDIDLDAGETLHLSDVQARVRRAIRQATATGVVRDVVVSEPKQTDTVARWKILGHEPVTGAPVHLTVEVSFRDRIDPASVCEVPFQPSSADPVSVLTVYTAPALAFKKVQALLAPGREAVRDLSDLFLLIEAHVEPPPERLTAWLQNRGAASPIET